MTAVIPTDDVLSGRFYIAWGYEYPGCTTAFHITFCNSNLWKCMYVYYHDKEFLRTIQSGSMEFTNDIRQSYNASWTIWLIPFYGVQIIHIVIKPLLLDLIKDWKFVTHFKARYFQISFSRNSNKVAWKKQAQHNIRSSNSDVLFLNVKCCISLNWIYLFERSTDTIYYWNRPNTRSCHGSVEWRYNFNFRWPLRHWFRFISVKSNWRLTKNKGVKSYNLGDRLRPPIIVTERTENLFGSKF